MGLEAIFNEENLRVLEKNGFGFSKKYIAVRKKENRVLSDEQVLKLPYISKDNPYKKEWEVRQKSANRFLKYLKKKENISILDIGCGNGWFTNKLATISTSNKIVGLDVNVLELEQAHRVFKKENLRFVCADIFERKEVFENSFDMVVLNASAQYFPDFDKLIKNLETFIKAKGEIHIIDSPFYEFSEIELAKKRTHQYYLNLGFPEMKTNYFHHCIEEIKNFEYLYMPEKGRVKRFFTKDTPFPWIRFIKK
ncbi:class I SAM-dependent methyltransferase [Tenacibaculum ovolyticum]|uniref:class I SAM-dependent methyltransferase n=1 Tax=Tenacibaculum ovolyticum TaxID=104270 RepID=UPI001F3A15AC|nr:methyltransferase domain-containing protein [Tenacibaculum ovolyticum]